MTCYFCKQPTNGWESQHQYFLIKGDHADARIFASVDRECCKECWIKLLRNFLSTVKKKKETK